MGTSTAEQNLLLGMLALQLDFISRDDLIQAMHAWVLQKSRSLASILLEQGNLSKDRQILLEGLVQEHLKQHNNDPHKSLAAIRLLGSVSQDLQALGDAEVEGTLLRVPNVAEPDETQEVLRPPRDELPGGRYRVLCLHAQGGLGKVSIAVDEELHREVAFKELRDLIADDPSCRARFILEAEVTGSLEHPGIVPVYGLGLDANDRPFYAMRFVRGESLQEAIQRFHADSRAAIGQRAVQLRGLLRRFLDVCNAVQYAHSRGVLHRDLKPSNVMLGKYGEALVVDWGLAKAMGRADVERADNEETFHPAEDSDAETLKGSPIGTPAYMRPQQLEGRLDDLGPASDVYSLGGTLYCLLTGRPPHADTGASYAASSPDSEAPRSPTQGRAGIAQRQLRRPRELSPQVPAGLEAICLRAMADEPQDRYATVKKLAVDIEHWLADEPTSAYSESWNERLARWMRHHRSWTQAGAAALILVAVVSLVATLFVSRARRAERTARLQAERDYELARDVVDTWLTAAAEDLRHVPGIRQLRKEVLIKAASAYQAFVSEHSNDVDVETERGRTLLRLGDIYSILAEITPAEQAYESAQAVFAQLVKQHPDLPEYRLDLANTHIKLSLLRRETPDRAPAKQALAAAIETLRPLALRYPDDARFHDSLGTALLNQSQLFREAGDLRQAESHGLEAVTEFLKVREPHGAESRYAEGLSQARHQLATILSETGRYGESESLLREAVTTLSDLSAKQGDLAYVQSRAAARISLASVLRIQGLFQEELAVYRAAIQDYQALCDRLPEKRRYRENLAITHNNLGLLLHRMGHTDEAKTELRAALDIFKSLATDYPFIIRYRTRQATCGGSWGQLLSDLGEDQMALAALKDSLIVFQNLIEEYPDVRCREPMAVCLSHFGQLLHKVGNDAAAGAFRVAADTLEGLAQGATTDAANRYWDELGSVYSHWGAYRVDTEDPDDGKKALLQAQDYWEKIAAGRDPAAEHLHNYAWFLVSCPDPRVRNLAKAIELAQRARDKTRENADYCSTLGAAYYRAQNWQKAIELLREAISMRSDAHARDLFFLAMAQWQQGDRAASQESYQEAVEWMEGNLPGNVELRRIRTEVDQLLSDN